MTPWSARKYLDTTPREINPSPAWVGAIDWEYVRQEVYGKGTTIKQIHTEVASAVAYINFWRAFRSPGARRF